MAEQNTRARKVIDSLSQAFDGETEEERKKREEEEARKKEEAAERAAKRPQGSPAASALSNYFRGR